MPVIGKLDEITLETMYSFFEEHAYKPVFVRPKKKTDPPRQKKDKYGELMEEINYSIPKTVPPETRSRLDAFLTRTDVDGFVVFEILAMDSSQLGRKTAVPFGPGCEMLKTAEDALGKQLGDVPSRFMYPGYVYRKPTQ